MISLRGARLLQTAALLFCFASAGCSISSAQKPQAPAVGPATAAPNATPSLPIVNPPKPASAATPPVYPITHASIFERMELGDGRRTWRPSRRQLGLSLAPPTDSGIVTSYVFDPVTARAYMSKIAPYIACRPVLAHIELAPAYAHNNPLASPSSSVPIPAIVVPAAPGARLDIDGSIAAIRQALAKKPTTIHIVLAIKTIPVADRAAKYAGINARIAHFVTRFNARERGRTQTVRLAINLISGHFVAPGQIFSLNQAVGERTAVRGFGSGIVFVDGHLDTQLGGGMCQVATTLFNAVLLANLNIVERHQHVRTVPYVHPGQDATIYWGKKDFQFQNDTKAPIYISYRTTASHAICDLFGRANPSVTVSISDQYKRLGPRHYSAVLQRYVRSNGQTKVNFETHSDYLWTPKLDYTF